MLVINLHTVDAEGPVRKLLEAHILQVTEAKDRGM